MPVIVSPPPSKIDGKFDDWIYLLWKKVQSLSVAPPSGGGEPVDSDQTIISSRLFSPQPAFPALLGNANDLIQNRVFGD